MLGHADRSLAFQVVADERGRFVVEGVKPGSLKLTAKDDDRRARWQTRGLLPAQSEVQVESGGRETVLLTFPAGGQVRGRVAGSQPYEYIQLGSLADGVILERPFDGERTFAFERLPPADYVLSARGSEAVIARERFTLGPDHILDIELGGRAGDRIGGQVLDSTGHPAQAELWLLATRGYSNTRLLEVGTAGSEGHFMFEAHSFEPCRIVAFDPKLGMAEVEVESPGEALELRLGPYGWIQFSETLPMLVSRGRGRGVAQVFLNSERYPDLRVPWPVGTWSFGRVRAELQATVTAGSTVQTVKVTPPSRPEQINFRLPDAKRGQSIRD